MTNPPIRTQIIDAVERLEWRVTLGDVASQTGLALSTARQELLSLAQDAQGSLQVSDQGDILYVFPHRVRQILDSKIQQDQWAAWKQKAWQFCLQAFRVSFGVFLITEFVLIVVAIFLLLTASRGDNNDNRRDRNGGGFSMFWVPNLWVGNPFWVPYDQRQAGRSRSKSRSQEPDSMNFLDAVYSFLFGDGDPNGNLEDKRNRLIGQVIRHNDGVVVAEQVLPFLDVPAREQPFDREDFMVPVLVAFDGQPEVSEAGDIIYRFPELQVSGTAEDKTSKPVPMLREAPWAFSNAGSGQVTLAIAFGVFNFIGAWWLELFARPTLIAMGGLGSLIASLLGVMVLYGSLFLVVPGIRWFVLQSRNQKVTLRNQWRQFWRDRVQQPTAALQEKIQFALSFGRREVVNAQQVIYRSDRDLLDQPDADLNSPQWQALMAKDEQQA